MILILYQPVDLYVVFIIVTTGYGIVVCFNYINNILTIFHPYR